MIIRCGEIAARSQLVKDRAVYGALSRVVDILADFDARLVRFAIDRIFRAHLASGGSSNKSRQSSVPFARGFSEFLRLKKKYYPQEIFRSNWYDHYKQLFADKF
jgi:hypothetical protein